MKKVMLITTAILIFIISIFFVSAAIPNDADVETTEANAPPAATQADSVEASDTESGSTESDSAETDSAETIVSDTNILLTGDSIAVEGNGVSVEGTIATINAAGVYHISGTLDNGQIVVDTEAEEDVVLLLDGVDITYASSAPIYVSNANNTVITLVSGTENRITDGANYIFPDAETDEPNGAIFSHDDLFINGSGSLTVHGNYNHGIVGKDDLEISAGNITVNAINDGIKGRDSLVVLEGDITVNAGGDGMQSNNDEDAERGIVSIAGGTLNITAGEDGIQAETNLTVSGGDIVLHTGGGSSGDFNADVSAKGLKAGVDITITGGNISIDSADDAIHANGSLTIDGGTIQLASGDDGVHADATVQINGGELNISQSYEGIESEVFVINDGTIHLVASDDGINIAGGVDGSAVNGRPGQNNFAASGDQYLAINGGYIYVDASGDGLDANGSIEMSDGVVIVNGPTENNNGPLDYDGSFNVTGGFLVAVGSAGMAQAPSINSTQNSIMYNFAEMQPAGTTVHIEDENGTAVVTFTPLREYQSLVVSSPTLQNGTTYTVYTGGSSTGTAIDGLVSDDTYSGGTAVESFTISGTVTAAGAESDGFRGGRR